MFKRSGENNCAYRTRIEQVLSRDPALYSLLIIPEPPHHLRDVVDSLILDVDPCHPETVITLLHVLSDDESLVDEDLPTPSPCATVETLVTTNCDDHPLAFLDPLSAREHDVLRLMVAGMPNREIARALVVTVNTVKTHVSNIYSKLAVHSRMEAAIRARDLRLV